MNALRLYLLGRRLISLAEQALPALGGEDLPASVRAVAVDVMDHPGSSISDIVDRTGLPQSHVSTSVTRLKALRGALETSVDPADHRRTLVRAIEGRDVQGTMAVTLEDVLQAAMGSTSEEDLDSLIASLDLVAGCLLPRVDDTHHDAGTVANPSISDPVASTRSLVGFNAAYVGQAAPWDIGRPQAALEHLAETGQLAGRVLDVGCGTGEHALMAAALGHEAFGLDSSANAIDAARAKARDRELRAEFIVGDALELATLGQSFDTILDCGFFHTLADDERDRFVTALRSVIRPGGRYHMLCCSDRQLGVLGPRRITKAEIRAAFADGWQIDAIEPAEIETTIPERSLQAWLASFTLAVR